MPAVISLFLQLLNRCIDTYADNFLIKILITLLVASGISDNKISHAANPL
ncbi:MAG: hypothetical protein ACTS77_03720 [Arsenophonus sp. NC-TX2-MAG3]